LTSRECKNNCKTHPYSVVIGDDTRNGKKVAIKKNKKVFSHSIEYTKRILRELKILKHISDSDHPNVLSLLDIGPINKDFDELYEVFEAMDADLSLIISQKDPTQVFTHWGYSSQRSQTTKHSRQGRRIC
jgi:serine/threonine protein kinase